MTEDDAKQKWCPFARVASPLAFKAEGAREEAWIGVAGANRGALSERVTVHTTGEASNPASARCIGPACMAWRWVPGTPQPALGSPEMAMVMLGTAEQRTRIRADVNAGRVGYCGLAGIPQ